MMIEDVRVDKRDYLALQADYCLEVGVSILLYDFKSFLLLGIVNNMNKLLGSVLEDKFNNISSH